MAKLSQSCTDIMDLFPDRVMPEPNSGCWLWTGDKISTGYGCITKKNGGVRRRITAHRISCSLAYGELGDHLALHKCDNKLCVNPAHLYPGTKSDNGHDAYARGQNGHQSWRRRADHPAALLSEEQIKEIRSLPPGRMKRGAGVVSDMARRFGVSPATIYDVRLGRSWQ